MAKRVFSNETNDEALSVSFHLIDDESDKAVFSISELPAEMVSRYALAGIRETMTNAGNSARAKGEDGMQAMRDRWALTVSGTWAAKGESGPRVDSTLVQAIVNVSNARGKEMTTEAARERLLGMEKKNRTVAAVTEAYPDVGVEYAKLKEAEAKEQRQKAAAAAKSGEAVGGDLFA